jgi:hypothetical protein
MAYMTYEQTRYAGLADKIGFYCGKVFFKKFIRSI